MVVVVERSVAEATVSPAPTSALLITIPIKSRTAAEDAATGPVHSSTFVHPSMMHPDPAYEDRSAWISGESDPYPKGTVTGPGIGR